ncbi:MAG: hypothetical protein R6W88_16505 [Desulfobacterales bacterium]
MKRKKLGPYIKQVLGISYKPHQIHDSQLEEYLPIIKANNFTDYGLNDSSLIYIHPKKIRPEQFIKKGDIVIAASSGNKR